MSYLYEQHLQQIFHQLHLIFLLWYQRNSHYHNILTICYTIYLSIFSQIQKLYSRDSLSIAYSLSNHHCTGHLYVKSDVYGFGVVLLELLTGLKALDPKRPSGQHNLVEWGKPCLTSKKKLKTIMDSKIEGQYSLSAAFQAAQLIVKCLEPDPKNRPGMKDVVEALRDVEAAQNKWNGSKKSYQSSPLYHHKKPSNHRSGHDGHRRVNLRE